MLTTFRLVVSKLSQKAFHIGQTAKYIFWKIDIASEMTYTVSGWAMGAKLHILTHVSMSEYHIATHTHTHTHTQYTYNAVSSQDKR